MSKQANSDPFETALAFVLEHEGGFVDDPADPGGVTNWGISLRLALTLGDLDGDGLLDLDIDRDGDVDADDIRALTRADAGAVYKRVFWDKHRYHQLPPPIAIKTFDLAVNMGPRQAHKILQRALRACAERLAVKDDGKLGPRTRTAVAMAPAGVLQVAMRSEAAAVYRLIAAQRPASRKYLKGWLRRAYA